MAIYWSLFMFLEGLATLQIDWKTLKHAINLFLLFAMVCFNKLVLMGIFALLY